MATQKDLIKFVEQMADHLGVTVDNTDPKNEWMEQFEDAILKLLEKS